MEMNEILRSILIGFGALMFAPVLLRPFVVRVAANQIADVARDFAAKAGEKGVSGQCGAKNFQRFLVACVFGAAIAGSVHRISPKHRGRAAKELGRDEILGFLRSNRWANEHLIKVHAWYEILRLFACPWNPSAWWSALVCSVVLRYVSTGRPIWSPESPEYALRDISDASCRLPEGSVPA